MDKITTSGHVQGNGDITTEAVEHQSFPSTSEVLGYTQGARKNYKRVVKRERKHSQVLAGGEYSLKSSHDNARVHSMSNAKNTPCESINTPVHTAAKRRKTGGPRKGGPKNEYFKIRQRVRYILNRMNYEQSLIEAYASGGWKGQSLEKIRPEKELERAKEEILRCKLRIREAFQNIDSLLSEGKLEESLFDSAGEISSEDIFCAKCGSKDVTLSNDIILCDGLCDRGFHQNCLNPPLLTEDIPAGDEGWLCPACDCKIDCIDILNEQQGSGLSIHDSWEKVFPEAAAVANGPNQNDTSDLPSDDSEDNDYDPNMVEIHVVDEEKRSSEEDEDKESDSDDSDFITSSEGSEHSKNKKTDVELNLASEDLEDDDYDPAGPDSSEDIQKERSSSDESDFTSDSDDFCDEIAKSCGQNEFSVSLLSGVKALDHTDEMARSNIDTQATAANSNLTASESELSQNMVLPGSRRRQLGRLDYKKLYEEAYGKASCDLSDDDDEEWSGRSTPPRDNKESETNSLESLQPAQKSSRAQDVHQNDDHTPQSARERLHPEALHSSVGKQHIEELVSNGGNSTVQRRPFGPVINQRLQEYFKTDPYPSRTTKETLAHELGLTFHQVNKWFENARRSSRAAAAGKGKRPESHSTGKNNSCKAANIEARETEVGTTEKVVGRNNIASKETMARNLNEGSKQDINLEPTVVLALPVNNQSCATSSRKVC